MLDTGFSPSALVKKRQVQQQQRLYTLVEIHWKTREKMTKTKRSDSGNS